MSTSSLDKILMAAKSGKVKPVVKKETEGTNHQPQNNEPGSNSESASAAKVNPLSIFQKASNKKPTKNTNQFKSEVSAQPNQQSSKNNNGSTKSAVSSLLNELTNKSSKKKAAVSNSNVEENDTKEISNEIVQTSSLNKDNTVHDVRSDKLANKESKNEMDTILIRQEAIHSANAAKSLTHLFAAIIDRPGTGAETPQEESASALNHLLINTHKESEEIISIWQELVGSEHIKALRQMITQTVAFHLAKKWSENKEDYAPDAQELKNLVLDYVKHKGPALVGLTASYIHVENEELFNISKANEITRSTLSILDEVKSHDWAFERENIDVASDLSGIAFKIAQDNELLVDDYQVRTNWMVNSFHRATSVVKAHYHTFVRNAIASANDDGFLSDVSLQHSAKLYDKVLENIELRAKNDFDTIERNALKVMGAESYKIFLPKLSDELSPSEIKNAAARERN